MRYTIPGCLNDRARVTVRNRRMPRGEWWAIVRRGDLLNGLMGRDHLPPVHRERVRFGAWEERPRVTSVASWWLMKDTPKAAPVATVTFALRRDELAAAAALPFDMPHLDEFRAAVNAITDVYLETPAALAAVERSIARMGGSEGPPVSGPENAYKCEGER